MRETCAEVAKAKGERDQYIVVGKSYRRVSTSVSTNMMAELYEAVWGALYLDTGGNVEGVNKRTGS
jgi:dsRNA-specific ribonuclease